MQYSEHQTTVQYQNETKKIIRVIEIKAPTNILRLHSIKIGHKANFIAQYKQQYNTGVPVQWQFIKASKIRKVSTSTINPENFTSYYS